MDNSKFRAGLFLLFFEFNCTKKHASRSEMRDMICQPCLK